MRIFPLFLVLWFLWMFVLLTAIHQFKMYDEGFILLMTANIIGSIIFGFMGNVIWEAEKK